MQALANWLECEECVDGELEAVADLGAAAIPPLEAALKYGPSPANIAEERYALETRFARLAREGAEHPAPPSVIAEQYLNNYRANYGIRAAIALGEIGGAQAEKILAEASESGDFRDDVRREVDKALARIQEQSPAQ